MEHRNLPNPETLQGREQRKCQDKPLWGTAMCLAMAQNCSPAAGSASATISYSAAREDSGLSLKSYCMAPSPQQPASPSFTLSEHLNPYSLSIPSLAIFSTSFIFISSREMWGKPGGSGGLPVAARVGLWWGKAVTLRARGGCCTQDSAGKAGSSCSPLAGGALAQQEFQGGLT